MPLSSPRRTSRAAAGLDFVARCLPGLILVAAVAAAGPASAAGKTTPTLREWAEDHLEQALDGGLTVTDFHHLVFAFQWRSSLGDRAWVDTAIDRLAATSNGDPLMVDEVRLLRAMAALEAGRPAAARELYRVMGGLENWWVLGPVGLDELEDFASEAVLPAADAQWRSVPGTDPLGWVRIDGLAWPARRQMVFLATTVLSEQAQPVALRVGAAQIARLWLNGNQVLTTPHPLDHSADQAAGGGWLRAGANQVVAAVASENADWWLRLRLTAPDGSAIKGVREISTKPASDPADERQPPPVRLIEAAIRAAQRDGETKASMALAALLIARRPQPIETGVARAACVAARATAPAEARLLELDITSEGGALRDLLAAALAADPDLHPVRFGLANWYRQRGLFEQTTEVLRAGGDQPMLRVATLDLAAERWGAVALDDIAELSREFPRCVDAATLLADSASVVRSWSHIREAEERLAQVVPGTPQAIALRERLAANCGDGAELGRLLAAQLASDPNQSQLRVRLALLLLAEDQVEAARDMLEEGLRRCPKHALLLLEMARLEHADGNDNTAAQLARDLLAIRPQDRRAQRLLELLGEEGEDLSWLRSPAQLADLAATAPAGNPAVLVLDHHEIDFLPGQLTEQRVQQVFLITASEQADRYLRHTLPYVPERQSLRVLAARILRAEGVEINGRQRDTPRLSDPEFNMYYDTRLRVINFQELADGDLIELSYVRSETAEANETGPYNGGRLMLGREIAVGLTEIDLAAQEELLPAWEMVHLEAEPESTRDEDGTRHLKWRIEGLPALPRDTPPAPNLLICPHLLYSSHPGWGELADWYGRHVAQRIRSSRQVEEMADQLTAGIDDRLERIRALYSFVTDEVTYVGLELGEHRFRPFSADWVLNHRIGDCKDKAALLVALMTAVDIPARMVAVRISELGPVPGQLALLESFNHAIAYLPEDDLWLDGTATAQDLLFPPSLDQMALVLVIDGPTSSPRTTPFKGAGVSIEHFALQRNPDQGVITLTVTTVDTGDAAARRRVGIAGSKDPRRFARWLQRRFPGADLLGEPKININPGRDPTTTELHGTVDRAGLLSGGGIPTYPGQLELVANLVPSEERRSPLLLPVRPDLEWTMTMAIGGPPEELPPETNLETAYGYLRITVTSTDDGYRLEGAFHLEPQLVPAAETAAVREFLVAVERQLNRPLEVP